MKKIIILILLTYFTISLFASESKEPNEYNKWKNLYWSCYFADIGAQITYTTVGYVGNLAYNYSINNGISNEFLLYQSIEFCLGIFLFDPLVTIPKAGSYISASLYLASGIAEFIFYSLRLNGIKGINEGIPIDTDLRSGIFLSVNGLFIILPLAIIQQIASIKMKKLKNNNKIGMIMPIIDVSFQQKVTLGIDFRI